MKYFSKTETVDGLKITYSLHSDDTAILLFNWLSINEVGFYGVPDLNSHGHIDTNIVAIFKPKTNAAETNLSNQN